MCRVSSTRFITGTMILSLLYPCRREGIKLNILASESVPLKRLRSYEFVNQYHVYQLKTMKQHIKPSLNLQNILNSITTYYHHHNHTKFDVLHH
ncbi:hypothetical protein HanXRQr2_Chr13g0586021 [Helianthus annuus]|uniref:Uncharacterized protein n=1 Tax=Helianthus annuus TaxID=4232 RepID=A0A9K3HAQ6_HELAN|nr:hypothetical protein HanXRQr2_Chr13g0586021 [Helianthus annuus]